MTKLSCLQRICCFATGRPIDLMEQCPEHERMVVVREAFHLCLTASISGLLWGAFGAYFVSVWVAVPLGIIGCCIIYILDLAVGGAEWVLTGMLANPAVQHGREKLLKFAGRTAIAMIFGLVTSIAASMALYKDSIQMQLDKITHEINLQINSWAATRDHDLRLQRLGPIQIRVDELRQVIQVTRPALDEARAKQSDAASRAAIAAEEMKKESKGGGGYQAGKGDHFHDAVKSKNIATTNLINAKATVAVLEPRLAAAMKELPAAEERLLAAIPTIQKEVDQIEAERVAAQAKRGRDPLLAVRALRQVFDDPVTGSDAKHFSWLMMAVLMTIEMSYVVVKIFFTPPSIYTLLLIKETRLRADREMANYEQTRAAFRVWYPPGDDLVPAE